MKVKIDISEQVKRKVDSEHAKSIDVSKSDFVAGIVRDGLSRLRSSGSPPGEPPRSIPAPNGNKRVEFSGEKHRKVVGDVKDFKRAFEYRTLQTALRACLYAGLAIPLKDWR